MRAIARWIAPVLCGVLALTSVGAVVVAQRMSASAHRTLEGSMTLYQARLDVAEAQEKLGESNIDEALESARSANAIARRVGKLTSRLVSTLQPAATSAEQGLAAAESSAGSAVVARRQTDVAAQILGAIAGYQSEASRYAEITNSALRRILAALRRTNREFPGDGRP